MKKLSSLLLALMASITFANAEIIKHVQIGSLYYNLNSDDMTAEVTYHLNDGSDDASGYNYTYLTNVTISSSVEYGNNTYNVIAIDNYAFSPNNTITSISISEGVTRIGKRSFKQCQKLTSISMPNSLTYIAPYAFFGCSELTSIVIPQNVTIIDEWAFASCKKLSSVTLSEGLNTLKDNVFYSCEKLSTINIPNSISEVGHNIFGNCTSFPVFDNVRYADTYAIGVSDKTLSSYTIREGTKWMDSFVFNGCTNLTSFHVPQTLMGIDDRTFYGTLPIVNITIADSNPYFSLVDGVLIDNRTSAVVLCPRNKVGSYDIPNGMKTIFNSAFRNCSGISSISMPNSVTIIGQYAFNNCALTSMVMSDNVVLIDQYTFSGCSNLQQINFPAALEKISLGAFSGCASLQSITLHENVNNILSAFSNCTGLTSITCEAINPPQCPGGSSSTFYNVDVSKIQLYAPAESLDAYRSAECWKDFGTIAIIGNPSWVRFVDWDGSEISSDWVYQNEAATPPADPTRTGYTFVGWDKDFSNITEALTVTALYEINLYKVDFVDWDGTLLKSDSVEYLSTITPPADPERTGYTFTGWDKTVNEVVQDTTITALYDINYYPVVLLGHDGKLLSKQTVAYKHAAQQPEVPAREGYTFSGWSTDIESILDSTYAIALYDKIGGTVTYLSEEGDVIASENVDLHLPAAPIIEGKSFKGWLTESADSENGIVLRATYTSDNPTTSEDVTVTPSSNSADVSFPFITGALTYELVIRDLSGNVVCKIMFNSFGQLLGIAFAPSRNRNQQATQSTGFNFTVEGLNASTTYNYEFVAYDDTDDVIETLSGSFTTTADTPTNIDNASAANAPQKYIQDGHLFIDNNNRTFDALGQQVR